MMAYDMRVGVEDAEQPPNRRPHRHRRNGMALTYAVYAIVVILTLIIIFLVFFNLRNSPEECVDPRVRPSITGPRVPASCDAKAKWMPIGRGCSGLPWKEWLSVRMQSTPDAKYYCAYHTGLTYTVCITTEPTMSYVANPRIIPLSTVNRVMSYFADKRMTETTMAYPDCERQVVWRHETVSLQFEDVDGKTIVIALEGYWAYWAQHISDVFDGSYQERAIKNKKEEL